MKKLFEKADNCILKYRDCWAGDVRTALCMRDTGILIKGQQGFNLNPPNAKYAFPENACSRPITFHHLLLPQIQRIYTASARPRRPRDKTSGNSTRDNFPELYSDATTYGDIFSEFYRDFDLPEFKIDTNMPGGDYRNIKVENAVECQDLCRNSSQKCRAWSFDNGRCWMKKHIRKLEGKKGAVTGAFPDRYKCQ